MRVTKIIPYKYWFNPDNGRTASIRGAHPGPGNWEIRESGFTWEVQDSRGNVTYGLCRVPAKTYEEALEVTERINGKCGEHLDCINPKGTCCSF